MKTLELKIVFDPEQEEYAETMFRLDSLLAELKVKYPETEAALYTNAL
jgi:hypothetical protein|tara:strand:+ start:63 stop:206 length:144 start_codon:yes stop_codon:yes gene_type:complete